MGFYWGISFNGQLVATEVGNCVHECTCLCHEWMNAFCFVINVFPYLLLTCSTTLKKYTVVQIYSVIIQLAFQFICLWRLKKTQHKKNSLIVGGTHWTKCQMEWDATEGTSKHNMGWRRINRTYQLQRGNWSVRGRKNQKKMFKNKLSIKEKKITKKKDRRSTSIYSYLIGSHSVGSGPVASITNSLHFIDFPELSNIIGQWIIRIWRAQKCLNRQQHCSDLQSRTPFIYSP